MTYVRTAHIAYSKCITILSCDNKIVQQLQHDIETPVR